MVIRAGLLIIILVVMLNNFINEAAILDLNRRVAQLPDFQLTLALNQDKYQANLTQETPTSVLELVRKINERENRKEWTQRNTVGSAEFWAFGERKIFCWALIFYSHLNQVAIQSMEEQHIDKIQAIFPHKSIEFLRYEMTAIVRNGSKAKEAWSQQEMALLSSIVEKMNDCYDWRRISFLLFVESKCSCFKALQECREKWCNYLNPKLNKEGWSLQEDCQLFELIDREGCRWALISRKFKLNRTEHMVKNRYNAYMKNWKNKRSNVKSKKGLINRIYSYLKARIAKKLKRDELQKPHSPDSHSHPELSPLEDDDEPNEYADNRDLSIHDQDPSFEPRMETSAPRQAYMQEKGEKKTAECEVPQGFMQEESVFSGVLVVGEEEPFNYDLMISSLEAMQFKGDKEEMKIIEDEVVRALGCSHFERALEPEPCDVFEERDSFSWLI